MPFEVIASTEGNEVNQPAREPGGDRRELEQPHDRDNKGQQVHRGDAEAAKAWSAGLGRHFAPLTGTTGSREVKSRDQLTPRAVSRVTGRPQGNG